MFLYQTGPAFSQKRNVFLNPSSLRASEREKKESSASAMAFRSAPAQLSFPSSFTTISVAPRRFSVRMSNHLDHRLAAHDDPARSIGLIRVIHPTHFPIPPQPDPIPFRRFFGAPSLRRAPLPWAHRALIVRALKGLDDAVSVSIASPGQDGSWEFKDNNIPIKDKDKLIPGLDKVNRCRNLKEVYKSRTGGYDGRCTVPMLWDSRKKDVLCNESYDIIEFFNSGLNEFATNPSLDLTPPELKGKIETWNQIVYPKVNNGVYRCGFAQSQEAYDGAVNELFDTFDEIEDHLGSNRYLCGERLTLADVCLFTTLIRFDPVYNILFKCTKKKLVEYPNLYGYLRDIYQIPGVAATCDIPAIMDGYYKTLFPLNASGIQPAISLSGDQDSLLIPHHRDSVGKAVQAQHAV
ncbi:Glutathione S-transferase family protein [Raphanus sativus]|nr:Glutathione S-transferase family protein [Raphanus sativus]